MLKTLRELMASIRTAKTPAGRTSRRFTPHVEALPDRVMPSATVAGGHLIIHGTAFNDTVSVIPTGSFYKIWEDNNVYLSQPKVTYIPIASVTGDIVFKGFDGDDYFTNSTALRSFAYGGNGNDVLIGGFRQDQLFGEAGNDSLNGAAGSDFLYGGDGNEWIYAGDGLDSNYLDGGNGNDSLYGAAGSDSLYGGSGNDYLSAGDGADKLVGGSGADVLLGNAGNDTLEGGTGLDRLYGGSGDDQLDGGVGDGEWDHPIGGPGKDLFREDEYKVGGWIFGLFPLYQNIDAPLDFDATQDVIYL